MLKKTGLYFVLAALCLSFMAEAQESIEDVKHIFVIHSYNTDFDWTQRHQEGIQSAFDNILLPNEKWKIHVYYLNGKKYQEQSDKIQNKVSQIKKDAEVYQPLGVVLTDDLAFSIFSNFFNKKNVPIAFSGVNNPLGKYGFTNNSKGLTGTLEIYNFPVIVRIFKQLNPNIKSILFVSDKSLTSDGIVGNTKQQIYDGRFSKLGVSNYDFFSTQYFDEIKRKFLSLDPKQTAIIILTNYSLLDSQGKYVHHDTVDIWIAKNTKLFVAGILGSQVKNGHLITLASSPTEMGYYCSSRLFKAIINQEDPAQYGIRQFMPLKLVVSPSRTKELQLNIPFDLLAYARSSENIMLVGMEK